MKLFIFYFFYFFSISVVSAVDVSFNCPSEVNVNSEFDCSLKVSNGNGVYDVKVEIEKDGKTITQVWDEANEKWGSAYYYLKEFVGDEEKDVKLIISEEGEFNGILKLRLGSEKEAFNFKINAVSDGKEESVKDNNDNEEKNGVETDSEEVVNETEAEVIAVEASIEKETIILNEGTGEFVGDREVVYESKNFRVLKYIPYIFIVFLIFVIGFLIRERI